MTFRSGIRRIAGSLALVAVVGASLSQMTACKKEEPPPPPPKRPPPPPPPPPEPVDLTSLMNSLDGIDARVQFPQEHAPTDRALAENILEFASALVAKDSETLRPMLSAAGRDVLSQVEQVWWNTDLEAARVVMLTMGGGGQPRGGADTSGPFTAQNLQAMTDAALQELGSNVPPQMRQMIEGGLGGAAEQAAAILNSMTPDQVREMLEMQSQQLENMPEQQLEMLATMLGSTPEEARQQLQDIAETQARHIEEILASAEEGDETVETSDSSATFVTALQDADGSYVLIWDAQRFDDGWFFSPMAATDEIRQSVRDWDGGTLNDFRVEVVAAPIIPEIPDFDDDADNPSRPDRGGGGGTSGG